MYKLFFAVLITFSIVSTTFAQGKLGSPYTRYGIGDINNSPLVRNNGLGGVSYALPYKNNINFVNPAGVAAIDTLTFIFDFGLTGGVRTYSILEPEMNNTRSDYQIAFMNFGFSINRWWKMAFGVTPYSNVAYDIASSDSALNIPKNYKFQGSGGITKIFWSNSFSPVRNLRFGVNAVFLFGEIYHNNSINFTDNTQGFMNIIEQNTTRVSDFTFDAGIQYDFIINPKNTLTIGAVYGHNSNLKSYQSSLVYNSSSAISARDTLLNSDESRGRVTLPLTIGVGLGYVYDNKLFVGMDFTMHDWTNADFFDDKSPVEKGLSLSLGTEYVPAGYKGNVYKYWEGVSYRLGGYFNRSDLTLSTGQTDINDFGISFGVGLPLKRSRTSFDISVKLGQRGTLDNDLIRERYATIGVGFNLADIWFVKSKYD